MSNEIDSSKSIEHLRLIHFTLVIACFGLLLFTSLNQKNKTYYALEQLKTIRGIVDNWNPYWLERYVETSIGKSGTTLLALDDNIRSGLIVDAPENILTKSKHFDVRVFKSYTADSSDEYLSNILLGAPLNEEIFRGFSRTNPESNDKVEISNLFLKPPKSILDFRLLWNGLSKDFSIDYFHTPTASVTISGFDKNGASVKWKKNWKLRSDNTPKVGVVQVKLNTVSKVVETVHDKYAAMKFRITGIDEGSGTQIRLETKSTKVAFDPRYGLLDSSLELRPFEDIFPELNQLSTDFDSLPFDKLEAILKKERDRAKDSFIAFGIKIPNEAISVWGPFVITMIQAYLFLHLSAFVGKYKELRENTDVPWIGIYSDPISIIVSILSSTLLPIMIVSFLAIKFSMIGIGDLAISAIFVFVSIIIGYLTFRSFGSYHEISFTH